MASPFSGRAGRLAAMWAANQATQGLGQISGTLLDAQTAAGDYLTTGYDAGRDLAGTGYVDKLDALNAAYGAAPGMLQAGRDQSRADLYEGRDVGLGQIYSGRDAGLGQIWGNANTAAGQIAAGRDVGASQLTAGRDEAIKYLTGPGGAADVTRAQYNRARGDVQGGYGAAIDTLKGGADAYDPLISRGMAGYDMYSSSLGINGAAGNAAARDAFKAGPGYTWQVDQATDAAQRAGNRIGAAYGGNTVDAVTRLGSNLANQEYGSWQAKLQPYQAATLAATQGKAQQLDELSKAYTGQGTTLAGLNQNEATALTGIYGRVGDTYTNTGKQMSDLYSTTGKQFGDLYSTTGKQASDVYTGAGKQLSDLTQNMSSQAASNEIKTGGALSALTVDEGLKYADTIGGYADKMVDLSGSYGGNMASLITGTANSIAQAQQSANNTITNAGTQGLLAGQQAAANTWGAIFGGLQAGGKLLSGSSSFGNLIGSLFK